MRIRITPAFMVYVCCIGWMTSWVKCICALVSLAVHEMGHLLAAGICKEHIKQVTLAPFGGVMEYEEGCVSRKGLSGAWIAAAGPMMNYLVLCLLSARNLPLAASWRRELMAANLSILAINILPAEPLDGGRALFCLSCYFFGVGRMNRLLSAAGVAAGAALAALGVYGLLTKRILNLSVFVVGGYLMLYAVKSRDRVLSENRYALLQERRYYAKRTGAVRMYRVDGDMTVLDALQWFGGRHPVVLLYENGDRDAWLMSEQWVVKHILKAPGKRFEEIGAEETEAKKLRYFR